jgi:excisionase family DNA binding protein
VERRRDNLSHPDKQLCDIARVATMLEVNESFVRRLVARQEIPFFKIGKFVRFDPDEVWTWVERSRTGVLPSAVSHHRRRGGRLV